MQFLAKICFDTWCPFSNSTTWEWESENDFCMQICTFHAILGRLSFWYLTFNPAAMGPGARNMIFLCIFAFFMQFIANTFLLDPMSTTTHGIESQKHDLSVKISMSHLYGVEGSKRNFFCRSTHFMQFIAKSNLGTLVPPSFPMGYRVIIMMFFAQICKFHAIPRKILRYLTCSTPPPWRWGLEICFCVQICTFNVISDKKFWYLTPVPQS